MGVVVGMVICMGTVLLRIGLGVDVSVEVCSSICLLFFLAPARRWIDLGCSVP